MTVRIFTDLDEACRTILRRHELRDVAPTPAMLDANERIWGERIGPDVVVDRILDDVRARGDAALRDIARRLDGAAPASFEVSRAAIQDAYRQVDPAVVAAMRLAVERIRRFHERHRPRTWLDFEGDGATGQLVTAIERVGLHVPGGRADYPSTVLMSAVPAKAAGCDEIVVCTPPRRDGLPAPATLVACDIAGVDRVFAIGGAQSIAAMAYGTETVPKVDKIVGPGSIYVVLAKRKVYGAVGIDQIPGPTETLILADATADPGAIAADMLAQAEHDPLASAIAVAIGDGLAERIRSEVDTQLADTPRAEIARESLLRGGGIVVVPTLATAIDLANAYAPEHLCLCVADPWSLLPRIRNAGGVFVGERSIEAVGDYVVGPSHVMPTGGTARFSSPMTTLDFVKVTSVFAVGAAQLADIGPAAIVLAEAEGLFAHAAAIRQRMKGEPGG